jgi:hypothetical protein
MMVLLVGAREAVFSTFQLLTRSDSTVWVVFCLWEGRENFGLRHLNWVVWSAKAMMFGWVSKQSRSFPVLFCLRTLCRRSCGAVGRANEEKMSGEAPCLGPPNWSLSQ